MAIKLPGINNKPKAQVNLTSLGRTKIDQEDVDSRTAAGKVLWFLKDHGQSNLQEIADNEMVSMSYWKVKAICDKYTDEKWGWIEWV